MSANKTSGDETRKFLIAGLRNAHAMENQSLSNMKPQLRRIEHYPEFAAMLNKHIAETEEQIERVREILSNLGEDPSTLKDATLSTVGKLSAFGNTLAEDEILQNIVANFAFEHFEIGTYHSLIVIAGMGGFDAAATMLEVSLKEEREMAKWFDTTIGTITMRFIGLREAGEKAGV